LSLSNVLAETLQAMGLDLSKCVSQCYDGASVMSGALHGVQARFRERCNSPCLYVHCHAHRLNLVLVNSCNNLPIFMDTIGLMEAVYCFFTASTLRNDVFKKTQIDANCPVLCLPMQSDTRWICKHKAVVVFKSRYDCIASALKHFAELSTKGKERVEANGLLGQLQSFSFIFVLHILDAVLPILACSTLFMQKKSSDIASGIDVTESTVDAVRSLRSDDEFLRVYNEVREFCNKRSIVIPDSAENASTATARRKVPAALSDYVLCERTGLGHQGLNSINRCNMTSYRVHMYAIIDRLVNELDKRFKANHSTLAACSTVFPGHKFFLNYDLMISLAEQFSYLSIDVDKLKSQTVVVAELTKRATSPLQSPEELYQLLLPMRCAFPDIVKFIQLVLTIPVSSAQAERSFSCLKRVKTYLRSTMSDRRLNNLCVISIEKEEADKVQANLTVVVDKYASKKQRRMNLML